MIATAVAAEMLNLGESLPLPGANLELFPFVPGDVLLPLDYMTMATVVYGARGSGKTTLALVIAEQLHLHGQRFITIDLKGDHYGLKAGSDGHSGGMPAVVFGGEHADIPISEKDGEVIGRLAAEMAHHVIVDLELLSKGKQIKFLAAFFAALYHHNRRPVLVIADECQTYAPQKPITVDDHICLGAFEDLVKLGRKHGIGLLCLTQRGSGLNKEVSELCDVLVAMRTPGTIDQGRVKDWFDANATREQRDQIMGVLAKLPTGTCVMVSGHPDINMFKLIKVRPRETFDTSATPRVGGTVAAPEVLSTLDLDGIRAQMAATIEEVAANDPKVLHARIAELEAQLVSQKGQTGSVDSEGVKIAALEEQLGQLSKELELSRFWTNRDRRMDYELLGKLNNKMLGMETSLSNFTQMREEMLALVARMSAEYMPLDAHEPPTKLSKTGVPKATPPPKQEALDQQARLFNSKPPSPPPPHPPVPTDAPRSGEMDVFFSGPQIRILRALADLEAFGLSVPQKSNVAVFSDQSPTSSGFSNNLSTLRRAGWVDYPSSGCVSLTDHARKHVVATREITSLDQLHTAWCEHLSGPQARIVRALIEIYPESTGRKELAEQTGQSPTSSGFSNNLSRLKSLGLVDYPSRATAAATPMLFPLRLASPNGLSGG